MHFTPATRGYIDVLLEHNITSLHRLFSQVFFFIERHFHILALNNKSTKNNRITDTFSSGDAVNIDPDQPPRVLPARGGDHPPHLARRAPAGQVSHLRNDTCFYKVSILSTKYKYVGKKDVSRNI